MHSAWGFLSAKTEYTAFVAEITTIIEIASVVIIPTGMDFLTPSLLGSI